MQDIDEYPGSLGMSSWEEQIDIISWFVWAIYLMVDSTGFDSFASMDLPVRQKEVHKNCLS